MKTWITVPYTHDQVVQSLEKILTENNYLDIQAVDCADMVNYEGNYCPTGFSRLTARKFGQVGIHFSVTIEKQYLAKMFVEKDTYQLMEPHVTD